MSTLVWLHGDSLSEKDPAAVKYPEAPRVFVFDRPFLQGAGLSFKRIFFLYECAREAAQEIRVGGTAEELHEVMRTRGLRRVAVTQSAAPRWRELVEEMGRSVEVEVVPANDLVEVPMDYEAKRFTPFWKKFGREWSE